MYKISEQTVCGQVCQNSRKDLGRIPNTPRKKEGEKIDEKNN